MWCVIFSYGEKESNFNQLFQAIKNSLEGVDTKSLGIILVAIALPIGVLIHQFSVMIKNWLVGRIWSEFSDHPDYTPDDLDYGNVNNKYYFKRISNLNSFYYVRFDNGIIAPALAFLLIFFGFEISIHHYWYWSAIVLAIVTNLYLFRIYKEINIYRNRLKKTDPFRACKIEINCKYDNK
jgi:hypothetical protein